MFKLKLLSLISALLITSVTLMLAGMGTGDLNSDPNARLAHETSASFDGAARVFGGVSGASMVTTNRSVALRAGGPQRPRTGNLQVPSRAQAFQSQKEKEAIAKNMQLGGSLGVFGGFWTAVVGGSSGSMLAAGLGWSAVALGFAVAGLAYWVAADNELSKPDKMILSVPLGMAVGLALHAASAFGAPSVLSSIGLSLALGSLVAGFVCIMSMLIAERLTK